MNTRILNLDIQTQSLWWPLASSKRSDRKRSCGGDRRSFGHCPRGWTVNFDVASEQVRNPAHHSLFSQQFSVGFLCASIWAGPIQSWLLVDWSDQQPEDYTNEGTITNQDLCFAKKKPAATKETLVAILPNFLTPSLPPSFPFFHYPCPWETWRFLHISVKDGD